MKTKSLGFIGGGRITGIILQALAHKKAIFESITVFDSNAETLQELKLRFPYIQAAFTVNEPAQKDIVFLAIHPPVIMETLDKIKTDISDQTIFISLAPKITVAKIASILPIHQIVRLIPNATSIINHGYNPVFFAEGMTEVQKWYILEMLNLLGHTFETAEEKLEAYALISAMLPTYFWFQWHELEKIGTEFGLSNAECRESIYETLNAALNTMYRSGMRPNEVMDLIPVKPIGDNEEQFKEAYREKLNELYQKIKP
ncbi:MAG TPA: NAD(P)-binding domain-containing protein [Prolixibacteraceae bacterium]|nr:NAD(P)-binding domain-containing protein [Prolixibacteraceae bacterium]